MGTVEVTKEDWDDLWKRLGATVDFLEDLLTTISDNYELPDSFQRECYELREGFLKKLLP